MSLSDEAARAKRDLSMIMCANLSDADAEEIAQLRSGPITVVGTYDRPRLVSVRAITLPSATTSRILMATHAKKTATHVWNTECHLCKSTLTRDSASTKVFPTGRDEPEGPVLVHDTCLAW